MPFKPASPNSHLEIDGQRIIGINYTQLRALCRINGLNDGDISQTSEEAHKEFMNSYKKIFLRPPKIMPVIPLPLEGNTHVPQSVRAVEGAVSHVRRSKQSHKQQTQEMHISHAVKAFKKFPIERSQKDLQAIHKMLKMFPCLTTQLSKQELQQVHSIAIVESWERSQIIFGHSGFYLILKGSVKPYTHETSKENQEIPTVGVGGSFGCFEAPLVEDSGGVTPYAVTLEACEILKISHSGYAKLKKEILAQNDAVKESLIQGCQFYLEWPKLYIKHLAKLIQLKTFPANQVLVREGRVCPFVAYIREGDCNILQDVSSLQIPPHEKGGQIRSVVVGRLGPMESFGELSILQEKPSPCTIVTATELQAGIILPQALEELDSVSTLLLLQTARPSCGQLTQEEINKEYIRQERIKEWDHIKNDALSREADIIQECFQSIDTA